MNTAHPTPETHITKQLQELQSASQKLESSIRMEREKQLSMQSQFSNMQAHYESLLSNSYREKQGLLEEKKKIEKSLNEHQSRAGKMKEVADHFQSTLTSAQTQRDKMATALEMEQNRRITADAKAGQYLAEYQKSRQDLKIAEQLIKEMRAEMDKMKSFQTDILRSLHEIKSEQARQNAEQEAKLAQKFKAIESRIFKTLADRFSTEIKGVEEKFTQMVSKLYSNQQILKEDSDKTQALVEDLRAECKFLRSETQRLARPDDSSRVPVPPPFRKEGFVKTTRAQ